MVLGITSASLAPYHMLIYSFAFGASTFQSFISAPIAFKVLSRKEFATLQNHIFPSYFLGQTALPIVIGLTAPYTIPTVGLAFLGLSSLSGAVNYFFLLPKTQKIKEARFKLEAEEEANGISHNVGDEPTALMKTLNKQFGKVHGLSLLFNLLSVVGVSAYAFPLAKGLRLI